MPLASGFVVWLVGSVSPVTVFKKAKRLAKESRLALVCVCLVVAAAMAVVSLANLPERVAEAGEPCGPHGPIGQARGIHPGRVAWTVVWVLRIFKSSLTPFLNASLSAAIVSRFPAIAMAISAFVRAMSFCPPTALQRVNAVKGGGKAQRLLQDAISFCSRIIHQ